MQIKLENLTCINENIDIDEYIQFREFVISHMEHPEWLGVFSKEDLLTMLSNNSKIWMYYLEDEVVCSMMFIPATEKDAIRFDLEQYYKEVADYGPMMVNPKYRGNGLQYQMLKVLDDYAISNSYKYALATINPDNKYSIHNIEKDNFQFIRQKEFTRGLRNIYFKKY